MIVPTLWLLLQTPPWPATGSALPGQGEEAARHRLTALVARSGRVLSLGLEPRERLTPGARIAPGAPPLLRFRYFEAKRRHRAGKLDLTVDDAGH